MEVGRSERARVQPEPESRPGTRDKAQGQDPTADCTYGHVSTWHSHGDWGGGWLGLGLGGNRGPRAEKVPAQRHTQNRPQSAAGSRPPPPRSATAHSHAACSHSAIPTRTPPVSQKSKQPQRAGSADDSRQNPQRQRNNDTRTRHENDTDALALALGSRTAHALRAPANYNYSRDRDSSRDCKLQEQKRRPTAKSKSVTTSIEFSGGRRDAGLRLLSVCLSSLLRHHGAQHVRGLVHMLFTNAPHCAMPAYLAITWHLTHLNSRHLAHLASPKHPSRARDLLSCCADGASGSIPAAAAAHRRALAARGGRNFPRGRNSPPGALFDPARTRYCDVGPSRRVCRERLKPKPAHDAAVCGRRRLRRASPAT